MLSACSLFAVLALTVYDQLMIKGRALKHAAEAFSGPGILHYLFAMFTDMWVLSGFGAAVLAGACWMLAIERLAVGYAYPFMALSFVFVRWARWCYLQSHCPRSSCLVLRSSSPA